MTNEMYEAYGKIFGSDTDTESFFSPGRVNLIGEHTDHEGGYVFPCAIGFGIHALARKNSSGKLRLYSLNFDREYDSPFEIEYNAITDKLTAPRSWVNYPLGVAKILMKHGRNLTSGLDILYSGNLPDGAGLSSSAALEVLTVRIFSDLLGLNIDGVKAALYSQEAENDFVGMHCGIMDQFAVSMGRKNHAILLNCSTLEYSYAPVKLDSHKIIITNSHVPHSLVGSEYNLRRQQCEQALADIRKVREVSCLCGLSPNELDEVSYAVKDPVNLRRALHAVSENARAKRAAESLKAGDLGTFGRLMNASHVSLRDNYEVTVQELDVLASLAWEFPGVVGSRMTGGGFGGCTVSIVENDRVKTFVDHVGAEYERLTGRKASFYETEISDGAGKIAG
ncbi:MAG: galactokinase [Synergistaceae bacterium]|nr:galactokinase [Synergistaceae bacterium]MBR0256193.1 galactokinase [Synergistaceae bacterium]